MRRLLVVLAGCSLGPVAHAAPPLDLTLAPFITSTIDQPIALANAADGTNRLFILGRDGRIWVKPPTGAVLTTLFLNASGSGTAPPLGLSTNGEGGMLGLAFHPNYETNRQFYLSYTDGGNGTVVARYLTQVGDPNRADAASGQVVIRVARDTGDHNGGDIHFGPDGYLYISRGDGGDRACDRSQTLRPSQIVNSGGFQNACVANPNFTGNTNSRALEGKILRIDVNGTTAAGANELCASTPDGSANYAIPPTNPFAGTAGTAGNCDEIWNYGLRNPFRFSFDRDTGDMFIGDVGEGDMEEVSFQAGGSSGALNFGWNDCEGTIGTCAGSVAPILTFTHASNQPAGCGGSITGGYRYRGNISGMDGIYIYSDYCSGRVRFGTQSGPNWSAVQWPNGSATDPLEHTGFGEDENGELYLARINSGDVLRFTSAQTSSLFADGFE